MLRPRVCWLYQETNALLATRKREDNNKDSLNAKLTKAGREEGDNNDNTNANILYHAEREGKETTKDNTNANLPRGKRGEKKKGHAKQHTERGGR